MVIRIPDDRLRKIIQDTLGCEITEESARTLTELVANDCSIDSLNGIQYFPNLRVLSVPNNRITNITYLTGLTGLVELDLSNNGDKMSVPTGKKTSGFWRPNPEDADVMPLNPEDWRTTGEKVPVTDVREYRMIKIGNPLHPPAGLKSLLGLLNLRRVELKENDVCDLLPLSLLNLEYLGLARNQVVDLEPLITGSGIRSGSKVNLGWNYLIHMDSAGKERVLGQIQRLRDKGVEVSYR